GPRSRPAGRAASCRRTSEARAGLPAGSSRSRRRSRRRQRSGSPRRAPPAPAGRRHAAGPRASSSRRRRCAGTPTDTPARSAAPPRARPRRLISSGLLDLVDGDHLLELEHAVVVLVGLVVVLKPYAEKFTERHPSGGVLLEVFGKVQLLELNGVEDAVLVPVGAVEDLDDALLELLVVDDPVVVPVGLRECPPRVVLLGIVGPRRRRGERDRDDRDPRHAHERLLSSGSSTSRRAGGRRFRRPGSSRHPRRSSAGTPGSTGRSPAD